MISDISFPVRLPFNLVHEIKVALVKIVHPDISILTTTRIGNALRMDGNGIQGPEMTAHPPNLVLEDLVVEPRLKLALACTRSRDVHGCLSTAQNDEIFLRGYGCGVEGCISGVGFEDFEVAGADDFGGLVLAGGYEVGFVGRELDVVDRGVVVVDFDVVDGLAALQRVSIGV